MDVDGGALNTQPTDLEQSLMQEFSRMGTRDRDELVSQMRKLLGPNLNYTTASFFLDMNDWNLQEAACCYLDMHPFTNSLIENNIAAPPALAPPAIVLPPYPPLPLPLQNPPDASPFCMSLADVQMVGAQGPHRPGVELEWNWMVKNSGNLEWPGGCRVIAVGSTVTSASSCALEVPPGQVAFFGISFTTPNTPGAHRQLYRLCTPDGVPFGDELWVNILIETEDQHSLQQAANDTNTDENMC